MQGLHESQKRILEHLLRHPTGSTATELAQIISVTKTAAKAHIEKLHHLGLIKYVDQTGSVGRPKRYYLLSDSGAESFPKQYSWLTLNVLEDLAENLGPKDVEKLMERMADKVAKGLDQGLAPLRGEERLRTIVKVMNDLGYSAGYEYSESGISTVEAFNCVYHKVAKDYPQLCSFDVRFLTNTSGQKVELVSCIAKGGSSCKFCLRS